MRSLFVMLLTCLLLAGPVTAFMNITAEDSVFYREVGGATCADNTIPGLKGETLLAVVEFSGHSNVLIDGYEIQPSGTGTFQGHPAYYYKTTPGMHTISIFLTGYTNYLAYLNFCSGKVTYAYYDQEAHVYPGMTRPPAATTVASTQATVLPPTTGAGYSDYGALKSALGSSAQPGDLGTLSVTTDPAGATIYIDGVKQGISPATIPGLAPGSHTLILKLDGYEDLSLPVTIAAGKTQYYSSALLRTSGQQTPAAAPTTRKSSTPGSGIIAAAGLIGTLLFFRNKRQ